MQTTLLESGKRRLRIVQSLGTMVRAWDLSLFLLVVLGCYISITVAEFGLALLFLLILFIKPHLYRSAIVAYPSPFWVTYLGFIVWSVIAVALAVDWRRSLVDSRDLYLYIMPIVALGIMRRYPRAARLSFYTIVAGALINLVVGIFEFGWDYTILLQRRISGLQGHYITFSGLIMIAFLLLLAFIEFSHPRRLWLWYGLLIFHGGMLVLTLTRSVWLGALTGGVTLGLLYGWRRFLKIAGTILVLGLIAWVLAPNQIQTRLASFLRPSLVSNQTRLWLLQASVRIIRDYPLTGIGPNNWALVYQNYRLEAMPVEEMPVHFHNNLAQIAVERGIPALVLWLAWYMSVLFMMHRVFSMEKVNPRRWRAAGAIAVWIALGVSGLFDYNFGDSEVQLIWLMLPAFGLAGSPLVEPPPLPSGGAAMTSE